MLCCLAIPAQAVPITGADYNGDLFTDGWLDDADGVVYNSAYYTGADPRNLAWLIYEAVPEIDDQVLVAFEDPAGTIDVQTSDTNAVAGAIAIAGDDTASGSDADVVTASGSDADVVADSSGPTLTEASIGAIAGLDVVNAIDPEAGGSAGAAVVDEPASLLTLGFGLTALVVAMKRQRRAA